MRQHANATDSVDRGADGLARDCCRNDGKSASPWRPTRRHRRDAKAFAIISKAALEQEARRTSAAALIANSAIWSSTSRDMQLGQLQHLLSQTLLPA